MKKNILVVLLFSVLVIGAAAAILTIANISEKNSESIIVPATAEGILEEMTLEEKVYQMMVISASDIEDETISFGGVVYFKKDLEITIEGIQSKLAAAQKGKKIAPILAVDEEGGRVSRLADLYPELGFEPLPPMAEITDNGRETGDVLADVLAKVGFNTDFAPVADVGQESAAIGNRAFSTDPAKAAIKVVGVVTSLRDKNIITTLKHFPGHGSALADTHDGLSITEKSRESFEAVDFVPFEAGIAAGADMIMTAHITAPALDPAGVPATFSKPILTGILREQLGFEGVIITDALGMGAVAEWGTEGSIQAIEAGVDILLMPLDYEATKDAIVAAVVSGRIAEERIDESVLRILNMKHNHGMF
jgi:beta-N-acetylhexosaminidase